MTLNAAQQAVVDSKAALRVVLAGPGSGKTRTMVQAVKIASCHDFHHSRVAIMTFTNAGANEFRQRLNDFHTGIDPERVKLVHCGTLHSYAFKLIQRFGGFLGYIPGKVGILPDAERIPRLLACRDKLGLSKLSQKHLLDVAMWPKKMASLDQAALVWCEYEFLLKRNNLVDYDGILRTAYELLLKWREVKDAIRLDYLFVDEFQDSAKIDQWIYEAIPAANKMYVGDPDQSIFAFRGAHPAGMVKLATPTPLWDATFKLEMNYRSDTKICAVANLLIRHNKERVDKDCVPVSTEMGQVEVDAYETAAEELAALSGCISQTLATKQSIAVLYRMNHDVKVCRDYLKAMGIPIQEPKYDQRPADWERALLLLGLLVSENNEVLAERYLKLDNSFATVDRWKLEDQVSGKPLALRVANGWVSGPARALSYGDVAGRDNWKLLASNGVSEGTIRMIQERAQLLTPDLLDLSDLIHALHEPEEPEKASNDATGVTVSTIHGAKGKEWDVVFLPAFEQGIIPHIKGVRVCEELTFPSGQKVTAEFTPPVAPGLEEERRLAFVAVTRARHELYISHCAHRRGPWGPVGMGEPSQFLREMGLA